MSEGNHTFWNGATPGTPEELHDWIESGLTGTVEARDIKRPPRPQQRMPHV